MTNSDRMMVASLAAEGIAQDAARALSLGLAREAPERCSWYGRHIDDCDCGMDEGD